MKVLLLLILGALLSNCTGNPPGDVMSGGDSSNASAMEVAAAEPVTPCSNADGAFDRASFVIVTTPRPGDRVASDFIVKGCSRTFESNVQWQLLARDGRILSRGFTTGGGVDGVAPFQFAVQFPTLERQIGHLEVYEVDASGGEGFPPGRTTIPLVLNP